MTDLESSTAALVMIGNSDDKLTQLEWAEFIERIGRLVREHAVSIYGEWFSSPTSPYQNACWAVEFATSDVAALKHVLRGLAAYYRQDSIAWWETGRPGLLEPRTPTEAKV